MRSARIVQRWKPSTGPRCQRAVIACPVAATTATAATNTSQNESASARSRSRERIAKPPTTMMASARARAGDIGPHQKSSGSARSGPSSEEAEDEPEVRRVEDVGAAEADQVLGEERDGGGAGEDPPAVRAPPVPVLGARHAQDERDAVAGEERARRPDERSLPPEDDGDLEHRARHDRDQDLRDRETEVERDLPQYLQGDDHGGQVQARVAHARQHDRVVHASDRAPRMAGMAAGTVTPWLHRSSAHLIAKSPTLIGFSRQPGEARAAATRRSFEQRRASARRRESPRFVAVHRASAQRRCRPCPGVGGP